MTEKPEGPCAFICPTCGKPSATVGGHDYEIPGGWIDGWPLDVRFYVMACQHCHDVAFGCRSQVGPDDEWDSIYVLWPTGDRPLSSAIPAGLRESFDGARKCYGTRIYGPAAVMIRKTLEGVCVENGVAVKNNLKDGLETLMKTGVIDARLHEWGQELRLLGNEGAHYSDAAIEKIDVEDGLAFTEALLDYIYVLAERFRAFKTRRSKANQSRQN